MHNKQVSTVFIDAFSVMCQRSVLSPGGRVRQREKSRCDIHFCPGAHCAADQPGRL